MFNKSLYFMIIIITFAIFYIYYKKSKYKPENFDIMLAHGGILGFYTLGICHFIKNNYNIKNKKMIGFSAGSLNLVFMSIDNKYNNDFLLNLFKLKIRCDDSPIKILQLVIKNMLNSINFEDLDLNNKCIGVTTNDLSLKKINCYRSNKELLNACIASSFIPFGTYPDIFYFYKGKNYFDGAIVYYLLLKNQINKDCLIVSYHMFKRNFKFKLLNLLNKREISMYELYIIGYHDAIMNKKYLDSYFL